MPSVLLVCSSHTRACDQTLLSRSDVAQLHQPRPLLQMVEAGVVGALMQMQSISYCGAFRQPAAELLRSLAAEDGAARQQMLTAVVKQPAGTTPAEWGCWWAALQQDLGLVELEQSNIAVLDGASL